MGETACRVKVEGQLCIKEGPFSQNSKESEELIIESRIG